MMPFSRYLQEEDRPARNKTPQLSNTLDIQIPSFLYQNPVPTLAHGGGAEVVTFSPSWFTNSFTPHAPIQPQQPTVIPIVPPSSAGLPVYSASGFDLLSLLARVATRPNPQVNLGPVDLTCSFVVVDTRRYDHGIVYCSPSFCRLTGYDEHEILGRNCRFLQAPGGAVRKGETRRFTSQDPVRTMNKNLSQDKEVQTSIVNFRKDGSAFINLVTVIPIPGGVRGEAHEKNDVVWHIGFQVDLTEQPGVILDKVRDGTYVVDQHTAGLWNSQLLMSKDATTAVIDTNKKKASTVIPAIHVSDSLNRALRKIPATADDGSSHPLSMLLLSQAPDFIHVVSLKGLFLYISPAITRILGYDPLELLNKTMSDIAHPEDIVPLERQLKESSTLLLLSGDTTSSDPSATSGANPSTVTAAASALVSSVSSSTSASAQPRPVDLVFRARTKQGRYVWLECRGRLHVEPGKGRKAIILSGRAREMASVKWVDVKEMARGPTITRALIQSALAASAANAQVTEEPSTTGGGDSAELASVNASVNAGTKRRRESSPPTISTLPPTIDLPTLPAKTTNAIHPHHRPLPGTSSSLSSSPPLTPPASSRHTEFWGMLSGLGHASGSFISLSRGVSDVLGYHPTSGSTAATADADADKDRDNQTSDLVSAALEAITAQQRQHQDLLDQQQPQQGDATGNGGIGAGAEAFNVNILPSVEGNGGTGSVYHPHTISGATNTNSNVGNSSRSSLPLASLSLRETLIGRRLRDLIVAESDLSSSCSSSNSGGFTPSLASPGSSSPSSGFPSSPSPHTPTFNQAASFGILPKHKGKENTGGDIHGFVERTLRAWEEESRGEVKAQQNSARKPSYPPPIMAQPYGDQPSSRGSSRGKGKAQSPTSNTNTVTVRCWMKTANRRGEWSLYTPLEHGNVVPVVVTLYRSEVAPMESDVEAVARGVSAIREAGKANDDLDVASPPTLVQVRVDTSRTGTMGGSPASSAPGSEAATPARPSASRTSSSSSSTSANGTSGLNANRTQPPESNLFAELETGRGSSWQYELQQMRFQNRRMLEEIVGMQEVLNRGKELSPDSIAEITRETTTDLWSGLGYPSRVSTRSATLDSKPSAVIALDDDDVEVTSDSIENVFSASPTMDLDSTQPSDGSSSLSQRAPYDYSYNPVSPIMSFNGMMDTLYAPNPTSSAGESPVIPSSGYQQFGYSQQQQQQGQHQPAASRSAYEYAPQQQQPHPGPYGYNDGYSQPHYQNVYSQPQYVQHQQTYVDEPMASPTAPYHSQSQQAQYTLHQPQPQHQHQQQGLNWGTAPTPHNQQQRRRSTYGGQ